MRRRCVQLGLAGTMPFHQVQGSNFWIFIRSPYTPNPILVTRKIVEQLSASPFSILVYAQVPDYFGANYVWCEAFLCEEESNTRIQL